MSSEIENACARFWLDEEGILRAVVKPIDQTSEMALDSLGQFEKLAAGKRRPAIIDTSQVKGLSREARAAYSGQRAAAIWTACALVVSASTVARTVGNFVIAVGRPAFPTRMFDSVEDAVAWARTFKVEGS